MSNNSIDGVGILSGMSGEYYSGVPKMEGLEDEDVDFFEGGIYGNSARLDKMMYDINILNNEYNNEPRYAYLNKRTCEWSIVDNDDDDVIVNLDGDYRSDKTLDSEVKKLIDKLYKKYGKLMKKKDRDSETDNKLVKEIDELRKLLHNKFSIKFDEDIRKEQTRKTVIERIKEIDEIHNKTMEEIEEERKKKEEDVKNILKRNKKDRRDADSVKEINKAKMELKKLDAKAKEIVLQRDLDMKSVRGVNRKRFLFKIHGTMLATEYMIIPKNGDYNVNIYLYGIPGTTRRSSREAGIDILINNIKNDRYKLFFTSGDIMYDIRHSMKLYGDILEKLLIDDDDDSEVVHFHSVITDLDEYGNSRDIRTIGDVRAMLIDYIISRNMHKKKGNESINDVVINLFYEVSKIVFRKNGNSDCSISKEDKKLVKDFTNIVFGGGIVVEPFLDLFKMYLMKYNDLLDDDDNAKLYLKVADRKKLSWMINFLMSKYPNTEIDIHIGTCQQYDEVIHCPLIPYIDRHLMSNKIYSYFSIFLTLDQISRKIEDYNVTRNSFSKFINDIKKLSTNQQLFENEYSNMKFPLFLYDKNMKYGASVLLGKSLRHFNTCLFKYLTNTATYSFINIYSAAFFSHIFFVFELYNSSNKTYSKLFSKKATMICFYNTIKSLSKRKIREYFSRIGGYSEYDHVYIFKNKKKIEKFVAGASLKNDDISYERVLFIPFGASLDYITYALYIVYNKNIPQEYFRNVINGMIAEGDYTNRSKEVKYYSICSIDSSYSESFHRLFNKREDSTLRLGTSRLISDYSGYAEKLMKKLSKKINIIDVATRIKAMLLLDNPYDDNNSDDAIISVLDDMVVIGVGSESNRKKYSVFTNIRLLDKLINMSKRKVLKIDANTLCKLLSIANILNKDGTTNNGRIKSVKRICNSYQDPSYDNKDCNDIVKMFDDKRRMMNI